MKTGLTKKQKVTELYFDERDEIAEIHTHNTELKKRLAAYAQKYPKLCKQTDADEQGGVRYEIDKHRISIHLVPPYSKERRNAASTSLRRAAIWNKQPAPALLQGRLPWNPGKPSIPSCPTPPCGLEWDKLQFIELFRSYGGAAATFSRGEGGSKYAQRAILSRMWNSGGTVCCTAKYRLFETFNAEKV